MSRRKITVKGQGPDARVTFYLEAYRDKIWITSHGWPSACEAIFEAAQADALAGLILQTAKEARGYNKPGPPS